jgi:DDE superfamily endonuclease
MEVVPRQSSLFLQRLNWQRFVSLNVSTPVFRRHIRMDYRSFEKLLGYIRNTISVDEDMATLRGGIILPEVRLYAVLRWLAGGSYTEILYFCGISKASFYSVLWSTIAAINEATELEIKFPTTTTPDDCLDAAAGFRSISTSEAIDACVCVADGYHLQIRPPSKKEAGNIRSFYSGHYSSYGLNIQGACDHICRFVFLGVAAPGVVGDREALFQCPLGDMIESLPGLFFAVGDCAYTPAEHMVPIFGGSLATVPVNSNFNFYASQCRIRIEMAFGLMVQKWGILKRPLTCRLANMRYVVVCIARLHNYTINERISKDLPPWHHGAERTFSVYEENLRALAAAEELGRSISDEYPQWSQNRDRLVTWVATKGLIIITH